MKKSSGARLDLAFSADSAGAADAVYLRSEASLGQTCLVRIVRQTGHVSFVNWSVDIYGRLGKEIKGNSSCFFGVRN